MISLRFILPIFISSLIPNTLRSSSISISLSPWIFPTIPSYIEPPHPASLSLTNTPQTSPKPLSLTPQERFALLPHPSLQDHGQELLQVWLSLWIQQKCWASLLKRKCWVKNLFHRICLNTCFLKVFITTFYEICWRAKTLRFLWLIIYVFKFSSFKAQ